MRHGANPGLYEASRPNGLLSLAARRSWYPMGCCDRSTVATLMGCWWAICRPWAANRSGRAIAPAGDRSRLAVGRRHHWANRASITTINSERGEKWTGMLTFHITAPSTNRPRRSIRPSNVDRQDGSVRGASRLSSGGDGVLVAILAFGLLGSHGPSGLPAVEISDDPTLRPSGRSILPIIRTGRTERTAECEGTWRRGKLKSQRRSWSKNGPAKKFTPSPAFQRSGNGKTL